MIELDDKIFFELNKYIQEEKELILNFPENWDDEGAEGVLPILLEQSIEWLKSYTLAIYENFGIILRIPNIHPCRDNSIDISWLTDKFKIGRMLVNLKLIDSQLMFSYYGFEKVEETNMIYKINYLNEIESNKIIHNNHELIIKLIYWMKTYLK